MKELFSSRFGLIAVALGTTLFQRVIILLIGIVLNRKINSWLKESEVT